MKFTVLLQKLSFLLFFGSMTSCTDNSNANTQTTDTTATAPQKETQTTSVITADIKFGKYGCTVSRYNNGSVEYQPRGFITLTKEGTYSYAGFKEPSTGTYTIDEKGNLHFTGGYLDKGEATKIDRPNKYFLVFPTIPDNRWTCGWVE